VKLVHLVGFITKKFVTMHGHKNVKNDNEVYDDDDDDDDRGGDDDDDDDDDDDYFLTLSEV
jgi:hypothetical protein